MSFFVYVSALLNQQMQRQLMLRDEYNREFRMLDGLRTNVGELEASLTQRQVCTAKFRNKNRVFRTISFG